MSKVETTSPSCHLLHWQIHSAATFAGQAHSPCAVALQWAFSWFQQKCPFSWPTLFFPLKQPLDWFSHFGQFTHVPNPVTDRQTCMHCVQMIQLNDKVLLFVVLSLFVWSLLWAVVQPTLEPSAETLCRSSAPAQGEEGNWSAYASVCMTTPRGAGVPPFRLCSSLVHSLSHLLLFITFFLFSSTLLIFFYCPSDAFLPE